MKKVSLGIGLLFLLLTTHVHAEEKQANVAEQNEKSPEESMFWQLGFSTGYHFTHGNYGTHENTDIHYVPLTTKLDIEAFTFEVTVPYIAITGTGNVTAGDGAVIINNSAVASYLSKTDHGLGDVLAAVTYTQVPPRDFLPYISATFKTKFPTADEQKGLGTGEFDYTVQGDISQTFWKITPFATAGYRFIGDTPTYNYNNTFFASAGATVQVFKPLSLGAAIDYRQSSTNTTDDSVEVSPFFSIKAGRHVSFNGYTSFGLTDGAADFGAGLGVGVKMP